MKRILTLLLPGLSLAAATTALADGSGNGAGNAGGAWVCSEDADGQRVRWSKLVDLYEVEKEYGRKPMRLRARDYGNYPFLAALKILEKRVRPASETLFALFADELFEVERRFDSRPVRLAETSDTHFRIRPDPESECRGGHIRYVQIATYTRDGRVLSAKGPYENSKFGFTGQAALIAHEAVYAFFRAKPFSHVDSSRARLITGHIFSDTPMDQLAAMLEDVYADYVAARGTRRVKVGKVGNLYLQKEWGILEFPAKLETSSYSVSASPFARVYPGNPERNRDGIVIEIESAASWIDFFGNRVPFSSATKTVEITARGELAGEVVVDRTPVTIRGESRILPAGTAVRFGGDGKPICLAGPERTDGYSGRRILELDWGVSGSGRTARIRTDGSLDGCIALDAYGDAREETNE